jgi:AraC-like DNA-binding protein
MPLPYPQPEYSALFRDMCRQSMASLVEERGLVEAIKALVLAEEGQVPTLEQVASHFSLSARSLRRHLRRIGISYRELVDEVRYASARRYLSSTGLTVNAIAGQLGYADARSFRTAFRRWSGMTPAGYRARNTS